MNEKLRHYIDRHYDPRDTVSFLLDAIERQFSKIGVTFYFSDNLVELKAVNAEKQSLDWFNLMPFFDRDIYPGGEVFWLRGVDEFGDTVMTQAARLFRFWHSNLHDELTSLRLFYGSERRTARLGEKLSCEAPTAKHLASKIVYSGSTWVAPKFRGRSFSALTPRLSRLISYVRWQQNYTISLVEPVLIERKVVENYGYTNIEPGITWTKSPSHDDDLNLCLIWMDEAEMLRDLVTCFELRAIGQRKSLKQSSVPAVH